MKVRASDGRAGEVDGLLINPETAEVTHMVLKEGHLWGKKDVAIPIPAIDRVEDGVVHLKLDKQTVRDLPDIEHDKGLR